jgi:hypothetical protein
MAEYFLEPNGQIHADLAFRLGKIIEQYDSVDKSELFNFDSSLCLCILQNLLTIYDEKDKNGGFPLTREYEYYDKNCNIQVKNYFNISKNLVEFDNNESIITVGDFLKTLRNAMSHPTAIDKENDFPSTGYYSNSESKKIKSYTFINSPDVINSSPRFFRDEKSYYSYKSKFNYEFNYKLNRRRKYEITNPRLTIIRLDTIELKNLTIKLAKLLSQPIQRNWDGLTFNDNILNIDYAA